MNKLTRRVIISTTEVDKEGYPAGKEICTQFANLVFRASSGLIFEASLICYTVS